MLQRSKWNEVGQSISILRNYMFDMKTFITAKTAYYSVHYITRELYLISEHGQTSGLETHFC